MIVCSLQPITHEKPDQELLLGQHMCWEVPALRTLQHSPSAPEIARVLELLTAFIHSIASHSFQVNGGQDKHAGAGSVSMWHVSVGWQCHQNSQS